MKSIFLICFILAVLCLIGCKQKTMNEINSMWQLVINSNNSSDEALNIKKLRDYLQNHEVPIKTILLDDKGSAFEYNSFEGDIKTIQEVQIIFYYKNKEFKPDKDWHPKEINNLFNLYLE